MKYALISIFGLIYLSINYRASGEVDKYLVSDNVIDYRDEDHWYAFDHKDNKDNAIIFYQQRRADYIYKKRS